ncbi:hypothetical protein IAI51_15655 [Pseudomonas sp. N40(2020)]|uniref:dermonecrotic toxin domain-containing protein n=1 Tax=Pseudomonas sp. N40(2020) TaxID=2767798 RepID=UPI0016573C33|nr:DUF6543 domain-containing protein [Pseudomonas sp. N40(2020)]MBC8997962.1 hypothetical protein [Pseudomonas sp. N40(2020)]
MHPTEEQHTATRDTAYSQQPDSHYLHLQANMPEWLGNASAARRQALKATQPLLPLKLQAVPVAQQQVLKALNAEQWTAQNDVDRTLEHFQDASAFAEPLLKAALKDEFDLDLDVRTTFLHLYIPATTALLSIKTGARTWTVSLLDAALHNFEEKETEDSAYEADSAFITKPLPSGQFDTLPSIKQKLSIAAFTRLCRKLDIGTQYKTWLEDHLGFNDEEKASALRLKIDKSQQTALKTALQFARMSGDISESYWRTITALVEGVQHLRINGQRLLSHDLTMMSAPLTGIVVFAPVADEARSLARVVAWVPDDPEHPIKEYTSSAELEIELTRQLRSRDYQTFFSRFINHEQRGFFFSSLNSRLSQVKWHEPEAGSSKPTWRDAPFDRPDLQLAAMPISAALWEHLYQGKLNKILNDAGVIAVATATVDSKVRWALWDSFVGIASTILQTAAFIIAPFVPVLGEMMMAYMAYQFLDEMFEGIVDWAQGQTSEALTHLFGCLESLIQLGAFAVGGVIAMGEFRNVLPREIVAFIDSFKPVQLPNGKTLYWKPDLTRYRQQDLPAPDARPSRLGLHEHKGKLLLPIEQGHYAVNESPIPGQYRIEHPTRPDAYQPKVRHNGDGAWHTEFEQPLAWDSDTALRRIGHSMESLTPARRARILEVSGFNADALRKMHVEQESLPPLLADSITRFKIDQDLQTFIDQLDSDLPEQYRAADPAAQLQLLTEHGRWPADKRLRWLDKQGDAIWQSSNDETLPVIDLNQANLINDDVLQTLLHALDEQQGKALLGEAFGGPDLAIEVRTRELRKQLSQTAKEQRSAMFESRYQASEQSDDPLALRITQHQPALPSRVTQELLNTATGDELLQINDGQLPERQQTLMQTASEEVRVTRAFEGLELDSVSNPDTDTLVLHSLARLTGWSGEVRMEIRDLTFEGKMLDSSGRADAPVQKILVRQTDGTYQPFDEQAQELHSATDLYNAILYALPDTERQALDIQIGQTARLKNAIRANPLDRGDLRVAISLPPAEQPPIDTLRLVGHRGYPQAPNVLSIEPLGFFANLVAEDGVAITNERRVQSIYSGLSDQEAQTFIAGFGNDPIALTNELARLRTEASRLSDDLRRWEREIPANDPASGLPLTDIQRRAAEQNRQALRSAIERCWRRQARSAAGYILQITEPVLGDLPILNADFSHISVLTINGSASTGAIDSFLQQFPRLLYLDMQNLSLPGLPPGITSMPTLRHLIMRNCGIRFSAADQSLLSALTELSLLDLQDNPLGVPPEINTLPALRLVNLTNTDIATLPTGLLDHPLLVTGRFGGNRITEIPDGFFTLNNLLSEGFSFGNNPLSAATREQVKIFYSRTQRQFDVMAEWADIERTVELFPNLNAIQANDLLYQLPGTLAQGRAQLASWETEVAQLRADIAQWVSDAPTDSAATGQPLTIEEQASERSARVELGNRLERFWRTRSSQSPLTRDSHFVAKLDFSGDMPTLSADFSHVSRLTLTGNQNNSAMTAFLQHFPSLNILELRFVDLEPNALAALHLPQLNTLELMHCGVVMSPETQSALVSMTQLETLELSNNPLGTFFDVNLLPALTYLDLSSTAISEVPPGLADKANLRTAIFSNNRITDIPDGIFELPANRTDGIDFAYNPLSAATRNRIKTYYRITAQDFDVLADAADISLTRELFPSLDQQEASEMIYDLPGTLADSRQQLNVWKVELDTLKADLNTWATQAPTHHPVTGEMLTGIELYGDYESRSEFKQHLENFWQNRSNTTGRREDTFGARLTFLGDMPQLTADFTHVSRLNLAGNRAIGSIDRFLELFPHAAVLEMQDFSLGQVPDCLTHMPELKELTLARCNVTLTAEGQTVLNALSDLELLDLSGNPLAIPPDLAALPALSDVRLANTGISTLPNGLVQHPNLRSALLNGNQISELPEAFFDLDIDLADGLDLANNPLSQASRNRIKAHYATIGHDFGVLPDVTDIVRAQSLFPTLDIEDASNMIYHLPGTLEAGSAQLVRWETEVTAMVSDLATWTERIPARNPSTGRFIDAVDRATQRIARHTFSLELEKFWRSRYTDRSQFRSNTFAATITFTGDLPVLKADFSHVVQLSLTGNIDLNVPDGFLDAFTGVTGLEMRNVALGRVPQAIKQMPSLKSLVLSECAVVFDAPGQAALSSLPRLRSLDMYSNPLGSVPDLSAHTALNFVDLSKTGITHVPAGLAELADLETALLNENRIEDLPDALFNLSAKTVDGIDLSDNPLSAAARERIKTWYQTNGNVFGVSVDPADMALARVLYPHLTDFRLNNIVYSLPGTLADGRLELIRRQTEIATLVSDLEAWTNEIPTAPDTDIPLAGDSLNQEKERRVQFKKGIEQCWRRIVTEGQYEFDFTFNLPITGELPELSADFAHVRSLILTSAGDIAPRAGEFLNRFAHLEKLAMQGYRLDDIPSAVFNMPNLTSLSLPECRITLTHQSVEGLGALSRLDRLVLRDNPLGLAPDLGGMTHLSWLDLSNSQISELPQGLFNAANLQYANLANNIIVELPMEMPLSAPYTPTTLIVDGNPLSVESLQRLESYQTQKATLIESQRLQQQLDDSGDSSLSVGREQSFTSTGPSESSA